MGKGSAEAEDTRRSGSGSPVTPTEQASEKEKKVMITVRSVMEGVSQTRVEMPLIAQVRDLKQVLSDRFDIPIEKQLLMHKDKELKDDNAHLSAAGVTEDCTMVLNVKMSAGLMLRPSPQILFFMPQLLPQRNLRSSVRSMTNTKNGPRVTKQDQKNIWTPEKQMEHELTRNRMKNLLKKRKKSTVFSSSTPGTPGSILTSATNSPLETQPNTPPEWFEFCTSSSSASSVSIQEETPVTEKELKVYFEPPETLRELEIRRQDMFDPPQTIEELEKVRDTFHSQGRTRCQLCRKKLPIAEQTMPCLCKRHFCGRHRNPELHLCQIDYKQTGRSKLQKEIPKLVEGGARKARGTN